jgi:2-oxoisovalerate dehydrogenase E1 component alpha subunit
MSGGPESLTLEPSVRHMVEPPNAAPPFQVIDSDGRLTAAGEAIGVDLDLAQEFYADMLLARRFDQEALALQRQGELSLWLMSWGQEAAQVGSVRALRPTDMIFPSYREHAAALCRGISPPDLMRQWRGLAHAGWDPQAHHFHIYSLVLGTQALHATGYAAGIVLDGTDEIVAAYFGDGAASQGDVSEAFNWAAAASLPVLFICQNNQWAISTPPSVQMRTPVHVRAAGFGMSTFHVDGNDVMAVHAVTQRAAELVRGGSGPVLIEAQTYRLGGHSSSDDPGRYRSRSELALWQARDPLTRLETYLRNAGVDEEYFTGLAAHANQFADNIRAACKELQGRPLEDLFDQVYAEPHHALAAERDAYLAQLGTLDTEV